MTIINRRRLLQGSAAAVIAGAAPRMAWARTEADVVVIGAGLAGLNAARILEAAGARVVVLEAEHRVGGRLYTLRDLPGAPDAGGIQVGEGYERLHQIARELDVAMSEDDGEGAGREQAPGNLYHVNGISVPSSGWAGSMGNRLPENEAGTEPASLLFRHLAAFPAFAGVEDWRDAAPSLDISALAALRAHGASEEAIRLIEANLNGNTLAGLSQIHISRSMAIRANAPRGVGTIAGGSQTLPVAMAGALSSDVRLGVRVHHLREHAGGVTIGTDSGVIHARHAICTVPFSVLRSMGVEAALSPAMARMIADLPYTRASFAYIAAKTAFWQEDGMPQTLWTDLPLLGRVFVLGGEANMLKLWTTGAGADLLDRLREDEAMARIASAIEMARPSARGQLGEVHLFSWNKSPQARGIYHHIGTGMTADLARATRHEGRSLHFAGEHLAVRASGMEGALESGESAARLVASRL